MTNLLATSAGAIIDIVALSFILIMALIGMVHGFMRTMIAVFGKLLSIIFAILLCTSVTEFFHQQFNLISVFSDGAADILTQIFGDSLMNQTITEVTESSLKDAGLGGLLASVVASMKSEASIPIGTTLNEILSPTLGYYAVAIISIVLLYILFRILFFVLGNLLKGLHKVKIIAVVDRLLGFLIGLIGALITFELVVMFVSLIPLSFLQQISVYIQQSTIASFLLNINLIGTLLSSVSYADVLKYVMGMIQGT